MKLGYCTDKDLISHAQLIHDYKRASRIYPTLLPIKLIETLKAYFEIVNSYPFSGSFTIRIGSGWYEFSFTGHDSANNTLKLGPLDVCQSLVDDITTNLAKNIDLNSLQELIELNSSIIQRKNIPLNHKLILIDAENNTLGPIYGFNIAKLPFEFAEQNLQLRKDFIVERIKEIKKSPSVDSRLDVLYNIYNIYINLQIELRLQYSNANEIIRLLYSELNNSDNNKLGSLIISDILLFNDFFINKSKKELQEKLEAFSALSSEYLNKTPKLLSDQNTKNIIVESLSSIFNNEQKSYLSFEQPAINTPTLSVNDLSKLTQHVKVRITSNEDFLEEVINLLNKHVKDAIELYGGHKLMWDKNHPKNELETQPLINICIKPIAEKYGIQVSREVKTANGGLDFLCSYNWNDLYKVAVEVKNAHHNDLKHGLETQLPTYMKGESTNLGVFLVLWYKSDEFKKPKKYKNCLELQRGLESIISSKLNIRILIIDCSPKISPSKVKKNLA